MSDLSNEPVEQPAEPSLVKTEAPTRKTADRPHWITMMIGLLSPSLALLGLVMSLKSLRISQEAERLGQRAYIQASLGSHKDPDARRWKLILELRNTGNTPAMIRSELVNAKAADGCVGEPHYIYGRYSASLKQSHPKLNHQACDLSAFGIPAVRQGIEASIAGKELKSEEIAEFYPPSTGGTRHLSDVSLWYPSVSVDFTYTDVFGIRHHGSMVCKVLFQDNVTGTSCTSNGL